MRVIPASEIGTKQQDTAASITTSPSELVEGAIYDFECAIAPQQLILL
jgi:hypothetical protein